VIAQSYATGAVTGFSSIGGLVGWNAGSISTSYALGAVTGESFVGGLIGTNTGMVSNSYSTGAVGGVLNSATNISGLVGANSGSVTSSYWDTETSGQTTGTGSNTGSFSAAGLTTSEFKSGLPFGFDPKVWASDSAINNGYPYLKGVPPAP
jgi:hypothetical protein